MWYQEFDPHPSLAPYIVNFWRIRQSEDCRPLHRERILPDGNPGLMFNWYPIQRSGMDTACHMELGRQVWFVGQKNHSVDYQFPEHLPTLTWGVRFHPAGCRAFSSVAMQELVDQVVEAREVFGPGVEELIGFDQERLDASFVVSWLNHYFLRLLVPYQTPLLVTSSMASVLQRQQVPIHQLASLHRMSARQVERYFQGYVGLSPKRFSTVNRFNRMVCQFDHMNEACLASLSAEAGYFDTIHMRREIRRICGIGVQTLLNHGQDKMRPILTELIRKRMQWS